MSDTAEPMDPRAIAFEPCQFWSDGRHAFMAPSERELFAVYGYGDVGVSAVKRCACGATVAARPGARP